MPSLLPALAVAHVLGIVVGDRSAAHASLWLWAALQALGVGLGLAPLRRSAALGLGFAAGAFVATPIAPSDLVGPLDVVFEGRVDAVRAGRGGPTLVVRDARPIAPGEVALPRGLLVQTRDAPALESARAGDRIRLAARVVPARAPGNPGAPDRERALRRAGLGATASPRHPTLAVVVEEGHSKPWTGLGKRREQAVRRLVAHGPGGGLLAALGLGDPRGLPPSARDALARLGLSHLVAVSGLHLALLAAPVYLAAAAGLRRCAWLARRGDTRRLALGVTAIGAAGYALATGFAPPVQRAFAFLAALAFAFGARRVPAPAQAFGAAALVVCAVDPTAPFRPGVQLSFVGTLALVASRNARAAGRAGSADAFVGVLRASASASAATAGLVALHFGVVSPLGWLSNGLAVPLTAFGLLPGALALGLALLLAPTSDALEPWLAGAAGLCGRALEGTLALSAHAPAWTSCAPGPFGLVLSTALAVACTRVRGTALRLVLAGGASAAPLLGPPPALDPPPPRVLFLDVGQGDATIVQGERAALLVDAGRAVANERLRFDDGERIVLPALAALGVRRLDLVVASHADADHRGGLVAVLRALPVARVWLPPGGRSDPAFARLRDAARENGSALAERGAGEAALVVGDLRVETLWPPRARTALDRNDASLVLRVRVGDVAVLLPGDLERAGETGLLARGPRPEAAVLKLAHHGSRSSSGCALLAAVAPAVAVVSAPHGGRFGMPHPEVVARLAEAGIPWGWTGRDGALAIALRRPLRVRAWRDRARRWTLPARTTSGCAP